MDSSDPTPRTTRSFQPGPGFVILLVTAGVVLLLALAAAVSSAFGAKGLSAILGGIALVIVGVGLLAVLRVPARSVVVNAPRLRLERNRARLARQRRADAASTAPLMVPGTDVVVPDSSGRRELTTLDVVSGPLTTALATTGAGRKADELLAGTTIGETAIRVLQLLAGTLGFLLVALGLASILGQVIA
ncbi:hypothetical protein [Actinomyces sp. MRS3W]|uniref:hypothetical protein n=1 Tax=Actinomyces sp. MRS3W TaxID=2800796 RepID=UPI0028FD2947|nr:hypothetical protein [Actinomyces sp. MRS3W]MDU0349541.1 hypothetical protein [Actinomyces sp. MRS3W]